MTDVADIPIVVKHRRLLIPGEINGAKVFFIFDTGASVSMLTANAVTKLALPSHNTWNIQLYGVGGSVSPRSASIARWKLGNIAMKGGDMMVVSGDVSEDRDVVGFIGLDIFARRDIEFDIGHGVVKLLKATGCQDEDMAYWAQSYVAAPLEWRGEDNHAYVNVRLNGVSVDAVLDTGSPTTVVTTGAAARAGVRPNSPGVRPFGSTVGVGDYATPTWMASFNTFELGQEKISYPSIEMADLYSHDTYAISGSNLAAHVDMNSMIIGLDFFTAHHMLISRDRGKVYFSYDGGPIFQRPSASTPTLLPAAAPVPTSSQASRTSAAPKPETPRQP